MHLFVNDLFVLSRAHMGIYVTLSIFQFTWILIVKIMMQVIIDIRQLLWYLSQCLDLFLFEWTNERDEINNCISLPEFYSNIRYLRIIFFGSEIHGY